MGNAVHVVARFVAKAGKEDALKKVLEGLVAPSRRELGCYLYDLLFNPKDPRDFCFIERWENEAAIDQHADSEHVKAARVQFEALVETPPDIRRYRLI